ncbi:cyclin-domain-containing protein, partial [Mortierella sp. GBAus27b]
MADLSQLQQLPSAHRDAEPSTLAPSALEFDIVHHPVRDTLLIVSSLLSLMVHKNNAQYNPLVDPITLFHSRHVPRISIEAYLARILRYIPFTNEVLLNMLVFLDRIGSLSGMEMDASGRIQVGQVDRSGALNIHRLLITCLMVASKFTSDLLYSNARYAMVGGLSLLELNRLELEFLFTIQFELDVKVEELQGVGNSLL